MSSTKENNHNFDTKSAVSSLDYLEEWNDRGCEKLRVQVLLTQCYCEEGGTTTWVTDPDGHQLPVT